MKTSFFASLFQVGVYIVIAVGSFVAVYTFSPRPQEAAYHSLPAQMCLQADVTQFKTAIFGGLVANAQVAERPLEFFDAAADSRPFTPEAMHYNGLISVRPGFCDSFSDRPVSRTILAHELAHELDFRFNYQLSRDADYDTSLQVGHSRHADYPGLELFAFCMESLSGGTRLHCPSEHLAATIDSLRTHNILATVAPGL